MASETIPKSGPVHPNMQHGGGTVNATPYVAPTHDSIGFSERPKKFNIKDFKRWQQKKLFYLTILNLARFSITSIRILIAITAINNLKIHQMDVKTAFLNGDLNKEIYIEQPEGFVAPDHKRKILDEDEHGDFVEIIDRIRDGCQELKHLVRRGSYGYEDSGNFKSKDITIPRNLSPAEFHFAAYRDILI
ncbi:hypothetical protein RJ639_020440 [Escallonia herrerae]|uniref:Reverse transcriptase Ty1/copia-type domain-containing protein n=1 Tax=Escallonia herrerae TaxID=1293975 RepID=A0AA89AFN4_9ASTE|nr:hypothetical protein RJ639_020440 [Escallonia herrerae]